MISAIIGLIATLLAAVGTTPTGEPAAGESIDTVERLSAAVADVSDGRIAFHYQVRDGVSGNGRGVRISSGENSHSCYFRGRYDDRDAMIEGPARAILRIRDGRIREVELAVGAGLDGDVRGASNLGQVPGRVVGSWFMDLAHRGRPSVAEEALLAASIARDAEVAAEMLELVRDRSLHREVRDGALRWLAILSSERVMATALELVGDQSEDMELRESAVFALGQLDDDTALPLLMEVAQRNPDPRLQRAAFFSLANYDSPEVLDLFEEVLFENR